MTYTEKIGKSKKSTLLSIYLTSFPLKKEKPKTEKIYNI